MNKRRNKRLTCAVPVEGKEGGVFDHSQTIDFSKGGIGLVSQKKLSVNKEIMLELDLRENEDPVFVRGKVQWVRPIDESSLYRIGLSFKEVLQGSKTRLNQYFTK